MTQRIIKCKMLHDEYLDFLSLYTMHCGNALALSFVTPAKTFFQFRLTAEKRVRCE